MKAAAFLLLSLLFHNVSLSVAEETEPDLHSLEEKKRALKKLLFSGGLNRAVPVIYNKDSKLYKKYMQSRLPRKGAGDEPEEGVTFWGKKVEDVTLPNHNDSVKSEPGLPLEQQLSELDQEIEARVEPVDDPENFQFVREVPRNKNKLIEGTVVRTKDEVLQEGLQKDQSEPSKPARGKFVRRRRPLKRNGNFVINNAGTAADAAVAVAAPVAHEEFKLTNVYNLNGTLYRVPLATTEAPTAVNAPIGQSYAILANLGPQKEVSPPTSVPQNNQHFEVNVPVTEAAIADGYETNPPFQTPFDPSIGESSPPHALPPPPTISVTIPKQHATTPKYYMGDQLVTEVPYTAKPQNVYPTFKPESGSPQETIVPYNPVGGAPNQLDNLQPNPLIFPQNQPGSLQVQSPSSDQSSQVYPSTTQSAISPVEKPFASTGIATVQKVEVYYKPVEDPAVTSGAVYFKEYRPVAYEAPQSPEKSPRTLEPASLPNPANLEDLQQSYLPQASPLVSETTPHPLQYGFQPFVRFLDDPGHEQPQAPPPQSPRAFRFPN